MMHKETQLAFKNLTAYPPELKITHPGNPSSNNSAPLFMIKAMQECKFGNMKNITSTTANNTDKYYYIEYFFYISVSPQDTFMEALSTCLVYICFACITTF